MKMGLIALNWVPARDIFRSLKMFSNRKIKKLRGNFPDAIFHVNVQFFLNSKLYLFIVRLFEEFEGF